jgi:hypothetical protein
MQNTIDAFLLRLPNARLMEEVNIPTVVTSRGSIEFSLSHSGDIQCNMENGAQLIIQKGSDNELWFYVTNSHREDGCFTRCFEYQAAVDRFIAANNLLQTNEQVNMAD